jgi:hypothetical protein
MVSKADLTPPAAVAANARRGLELRERFHKGGTDVGVHRAEQLTARRPVTREDVKSMYSYLARHDVDKQGAHFGDEAAPSPGYVAWLLWGGDEAKTWIAGLHARVDEIDEGGDTAHAA